MFSKKYQMNYRKEPTLEESSRYSLQSAFSHSSRYRSTTSSILATRPCYSPCAGNLEIKWSTSPINRINIDITFPRLPCEIVGIEQQDAVLSSNYEITSVRKFRIDQDGNELGEVETIDNLQRMPRDEIKYYDDIKATLENKHGCRMRGDFSVNEVPGIFRFTLEEHI